MYGSESTKPSGYRTTEGDRWIRSSTRTTVECRAGTHPDLLKQANVWYHCTVYLNSFTTAGKQAITARSRLVVILQRRSMSLSAALPWPYRILEWTGWAWAWLAYGLAVRAATVHANKHQGNEHILANSHESYGSLHRPELFREPLLAPIRFVYGRMVHACKTQRNTQSLCGQSAPAHLHAEIWRTGKCCFDSRCAQGRVSSCVRTVKA